MIQYYSKQKPTTPTLTYVAESERDADRLRGQLDAPVRIRKRHNRVTIDLGSGEGIATTTSEIPRTLEVIATPGTDRRQSL